MRTYELGVILHPTVEQTDVTPAVDQVSHYVEAGGGTVAAARVWGRRMLAYPIEKQKEGTYVFLEVQIESDAIGELERNLKLDEKVIRYMLVRP